MNPFNDVLEIGHNRHTDREQMDRKGRYRATSGRTHMAN